jgi:hypothetical protein
MARKRLTAVLVAAAALGSTAPAAVAQPEPDLPKDAALVATTPSGARMFAFDHKRKLCTAFLAPRERRSFALGDCQRPVHSLRYLQLGETGYPHRSYHHGIVEPDVASIELVLPRGRTVRAETSAGAAYTGRYAGKVRFVIAEVRGNGVEDEPRYIRQFDASGALLALADTYGFEDDVIGRRRQLGRGRAGGLPWSLRAFRVRMLASLPGEIERFVAGTCVDVRRLGRVRDRSLFNPRSGRARACVNPERRGGEEYGLDQDCELGVITTGIVSPDTRAVVAVLGDGSTRRVPLRRLPARLGGGRAFGIALGPRVALRRLVVFGQGRRRVVQRDVGPGSVRCTADGFVAFFSGLEPAAPHGPTALTVYDDGVQLCATLGRPSDHPDECRYPPIGLEEAWILTRRHGDRKLVAGIVPAAVVEAVVELRGGRRIPVDLAAHGTYAGRYSSAVRLFTLDLSAGDSLEEVHLVDAHGRRSDVYGYEEPPPLGPRRLVVGGPPGLRLRAQLRGSGREIFDSYLCISLGGGDCSFGYGGSVLVRSDCNPRRLVVWGLLPPGVTGVTVETDRGDFRARVRRLPRALRQRVPARPRYLRRIQPVAAFVLALPAKAEPRTLVLSGRKTTRGRLSLPPASEQCGYDDFRF